MSTMKESKVRIIKLKEAIDKVGISQSKLLMSYAGEIKEFEEDVQTEFQRLKKGIQKSRLSLSKNDIDGLFEHLALLDSEINNDCVVSGPLKEAILDKNLSNVMGRLSKKLDKKLAAEEKS